MEWSKGSKRVTVPWFSMLPGAVLLPIAMGLAQERPNFLWLTVEDMSPLLASYGVPEARTPHLDKLAKEGIVYSQAFASSPVCAVMRASLLTGLYSPSQGTHHMRNTAVMGKGVKPYPVHLREAGYHCTNPGKMDYQGLAGREIWDAARDYQERSDKTRPFMHVINYDLTHESRGGGSIGSYDPALLPLPPYYPATAKVRTAWASHFNSISAMDSWVGARLAELEQSGEADKTIVFFYSDHGSGLPRAKRWVYDSGIRIPLLVRIPPRFRRPGADLPGSVNAELISSVDFAPTLLNLAGAAIPSPMQGRAFLGRNLQAPRKYVFASRDRMDERYDIVRAVRDGRYQYIRNYEYFKPRLQYNEYAEAHPWSGIMEEIRRVNAAGNPPPAIAWYFRYKPLEELYDTREDPHEMIDLARNPAFREKLAELRAALLKWRGEIRDLGSIPEGLILERRTALGSGAGEFDLGKASIGQVDSAWAVLDSLAWKSEIELLRMLGSRDPAVRYWAATGLGNHPSPTATAREALNRGLRDPSPWVGVAAARGLLLAGSSQAALDSLKSMLRHADSTVRHAAVLVCDEIGNRAIPLKANLQTAGQDHYEPVRRVSIRALATLDHLPESPPALRRGCPDPASAAYRPDYDLPDGSLCRGVWSPKPNAPSLAIRKKGYGTAGVRFPMEFVLDGGKGRIDAKGVRRPAIP